MPAIPHPARNSPSMLSVRHRAIFQAFDTLTSVLPADVHVFWADADAHLPDIVVMAPGSGIVVVAVLPGAGYDFDAVSDRCDGDALSRLPGCESLMGLSPPSAFLVVLPDTPRAHCAHWGSLGGRVMFAEDTSRLPSMVLADLCETGVATAGPAVVMTAANIAQLAAIADPPDEEPQEPRSPPPPATRLLCGPGSSIGPTPAHLPALPALPAQPTRDDDHVHSGPPAAARLPRRPLGLLIVTLVTAALAYVTYVESAPPRLAPISTASPASSSTLPAPVHRPQHPAGTPHRKKIHRPASGSER